MNLKFPSKLPLARLPTPLQHLPRLSRALGGAQLWLKRDDLTEFGAGGNKIRKLEYVLADALAKGADCILTCGGVQSNHCRATALLAARLGLSCHLILRGENPPVLQGNALLAELGGAKMSFHSLAQYQHLDQLFEHYTNHYLALGHKPYCIPTGASDEVGLWGYIEAAAELKYDVNEAALDNVLVCCATGSGGTHTGLALGMALCGGPAVKGYAVCDDKDHFISKAQRDIQLWHERYARLPELPEVALEVSDAFIGPGYARSYPELVASIREVASTEGVLLDPVYTGKAFYGMTDELRRGALRQYDHLVFVHTGGVFGLFPQGHTFFENV